MKRIIHSAPIIGFVRYSQKIEFGKKTRDVFEPDYFEYRFKIFQEITLKSFQQQTEKEFILLLLHSAAMPNHLKERFLALEKTNNFLRNVFIEDNSASFAIALKNSIEYANFQKGAVVTFRVDNDDAVPNNFIAKLKYFLREDLIGYAISAPTVVIVKRISNQMVLMQQKYYPSNSIGLAYVSGLNNFKTVMDAAQHHQINHNNPMVLTAGNVVGGLMTINGANAINFIDPSHSQIASNEEIKKYMADHRFGNLDLNCMKIFEDASSNSRSYLSKIVHYLTPPLFHIILRKKKSYL